MRMGRDGPKKEDILYIHDSSESCEREYRESIKSYGRVERELRAGRDRVGGKRVRMGEGKGSNEIE